MESTNDANKEVRKPTGIDPYTEVPEGNFDETDEEQRETCIMCENIYTLEFMNGKGICYICLAELEED